MKGNGYRAAMESGYNFTYAVHKRISSEKLTEHLSEVEKYRRNLGLSFLRMDSALFRERQQQAWEFNLPLPRIDYRTPMDIGIQRAGWSIINMFDPGIAKILQGESIDILCNSLLPL